MNKHFSKEDIQMPTDISKKKKKNKLLNITNHQRNCKSNCKSKGMGKERGHVVQGKESLREAGSLERWVVKERYDRKKCEYI